MDCADAVVTHLPNVMAFVRHHVRSGRAKGLSVPQLRSLVRVERGGNLSEVACWLGITLPTASRIVSGLVGKGYLQRVECPVDRRVRKLSLTPRGQRVLREAFDASRKAMEAELRRLPNADCKQIARSVRLLAELFTDTKAG